MSCPPSTVLTEIVEATRATGAPVTVATLAESLAVPRSELRETVERLQSLELVAGTESGYRPTVTARELLAADIELDETLVLDVVEE